MGPNTLNDINDTHDKSKTILLLDALDEDPNAFGKVKNRLLDVLGKVETFRRVIITCRTQFFPDDEVDPFKRIGKIKIGNYICPMIFLSLFDDDQVNEYLIKRFSDNTQREKAKTIVNNMGSLQFRPLLL